MITAFGVFGCLLIYALLRRFWLTPRRSSARHIAAESGGEAEQKAHLKDLTDIDIAALEAWVSKQK